MNIRIKLLVLAGITMLSVNGFADRLEKREFKIEATNPNKDKDSNKQEKIEKIKPVKKLKYNPPFRGCSSNGSSGWNGFTQSSPH